MTAISALSRRKPWALLASIYITQYIGLAFVFAATVAIMRDMGVALDKLALINIIALPLLLKIFYAPIIDHIRLSILGRTLQGQYRSWLIIAQLLMMLLLLIISSIDIIHQFNLMLALWLIYAFSVSVQDVAIDGLACKICLEDERGRANSVQFAGNLVGNIIGGGLILMAYPWLGWQGSLWILIILTAAAWLGLLFYTEPEPVNNGAHNPSLGKTLKQLTSELIGFIDHHKAWFGLLLIYPIGFSASFALINPILVDSNWSLVDIGFATKVFGSLVGVLSAISASLLIAKLGRHSTLTLLTIAQSLTLITFLPLAFGNTSKLMVYIAIGTYFLVNPALMATLATIIMDKASQQSAKATFFTLQLGLVAFMGFVYAGLAMMAAKHFGYSNVVLFGIVMTFVISLIIYLKRETLI